MIEFMGLASLPDQLAMVRCRDRDKILVRALARYATRPTSTSNSWLHDVVREDRADQRHVFTPRSSSF